MMPTLPLLVGRAFSQFMRASLPWILGVSLGTTGLVLFSGTDWGHRDITRDHASVGRLLPGRPHPRRAGRRLLIPLSSRAKAIRTRGHGFLGCGLGMTEL